MRTSSMTSVCLARFQKEAISSHLSPVKKRAKENTPPNTNAAQVPAHTTDWQRGSTTAKTSSYKTQRHTIVIPDTPSPAVSVITISSDSDSEEERKCSGSPRGLVSISDTCIALLTYFTIVGVVSSDVIAAPAAQLPSRHARYRCIASWCAPYFFSQASF